MENKTYYAETKCKNCKRVNYLMNIPLGLDIETYCLNERLRCRVCGCLLFEEKEEKEVKGGKNKKKNADK